MTKPRSALTLEKALVRIADVLPGGFDEMAEVTNRPPHRVRAWADPDKRERIPVPDALLLDKACDAAGGGTPILEFMAARLGAAGALDQAAPAASASHAANCVRECGEAVAALIDGSDEDIRRELGQAIEALWRALADAVGREAFEGLFGRLDAEPHQTGPPRPH